LRYDSHRRSGDDGPGFIGNRSGKTPVRLAVKKRTEEKDGTRNRYEQRFSFQHEFSPCGHSSLQRVAIWARLPRGWNVERPLFYDAPSK
jgi:hypothetical protein